MQWNNLMWLFNECTCKILVPESINLSYVTNILPDMALQTARSNLQFFVNGDQHNSKIKCHSEF